VARLPLGEGPVLTVTYGYYNWKEEGGRGRLQGLAATNDLQDLRYAYDLAGNVVAIADWIADSPQTQAFGYDALNRLITATASGTSGEGGYGLEAYHYNAIGNITAKGNPAYGYQDAAHVHAVTHLTYLQQNDQRYWYDANGNQVKRIVEGETYTLTYDAENHLTEVVTPEVHLGYYSAIPQHRSDLGTRSTLESLHAEQGADYSPAFYGEA